MSREVTVLRLKALHQKNLVKAKKIIVDSITDHIVPQVSSLNTLKMFDSLTKLFEGKNINQKMALRNQLKNVKIQNVETMQSYFTRVSQIKEQLEVVSEECRSGDGHLEWTPRIMGFIHVRNVC